MGQIVRMEEFHSKRGGPPSAPRADPAEASASPPAGTQFVFRELKAGEQRIEGTLERIDCVGNGPVTLVVRSGTDVKRFTALQFSDIDFFTYREQQSGSVSCGNRKPPEAVYVTWRALSTPATGVTGRPVAVEFLPDKR
jgi:hypothetical protein